MSDINIKETIEDENSWFNVKRYSINGLGDNFSQKTLDVSTSNLNKKAFENVAGPTKKNFIFEKSKKIGSIDEVNSIINSSDDQKTKDFFGWKKWLDERFLVINLTFQFNPYKEISSIEKIGRFFDFYYSFSKNILCVPNIRTEKSALALDDKSTRGKVKIIEIDDYIRFVDEVYNYFSIKNNKHIFVPISLRFSMGDIQKLIEHYIKKEYFYYWIDFEGKTFEPAQTARLRAINNLLKEKNFFDKTIAYFTNIKREIKSNVKEDNSPASDVLGTLFGANIVGVDRDPPRLFPNGQKVQPIAFAHKARLFDDSTYYYKKTQQADLLTRPVNITTNSLRLDKEFVSQRENFLKDLELQKYLKTKEMLKTYRDGKILSELQKETSRKGKSIW